VTVLGSLPSVSAGEWLTAEGWWAQDKEHGLQFKARTLKAVPPTTSEGVERYLAGGFVKEVGPVPAKKLAGHFGAEVLGVIGNSLAVVCSTWPRLPARHIRPHGSQEPTIVTWIVFRLRLSRSPLASLFGSFRFNLRSIAIDLGSAAIFWIGSFVVMGALVLAWSGIVAGIAHSATSPLSSGALQMEIARADANGALQQQGNSRMNTALSHRRLWRGGLLPRLSAAPVHRSCTWPPGRRGVAIGSLLRCRACV